jgi:S1-C subfamily serine protease
MRNNHFVTTSQLTVIENLFASAPIFPGNSGGPVLDTNGTVVGISAFVYNNDDYAPPLGLSTLFGGPNQFSAQPIVSAIRTNNSNYTGFSVPLAKSYWGLATYAAMDGLTLQAYRNAFPLFNNGGLDLPRGIVVLSLDNADITVPGSRLSNATTPIQVNDIIIQVQTLVSPIIFLNIGVLPGETHWGRITHFRPPGQTIAINVVRPSTNTEFQTFVTLDNWPTAKDYVFVGNTSSYKLIPPPSQREPVIIP